jgi:hypothetical protein
MPWYSDELPANVQSRQTRKWGAGALSGYHSTCKILTVTVTLSKFI